MDRNNPLDGVEALIFDLMGTCTDWHSSVVAAMNAYPLPLPLTESDLPTLAADWRAGFFTYIFESFERGEEAPDIDTVHSRVLDALLKERDVVSDVWDDHVKNDLVKAWHRQQAWSDSIEGIIKLKKRFIVVVLANGTTRLQLDIVRSAYLPFDSLFSSQLLQATKPSTAIYEKALDLLALRPEQTAMVAAHAYDLRAAKTVGMRTVYIRRSTEDPAEDMDKVRDDVDIFIDGRGEDKGLLELARMTNA